MITAELIVERDASGKAVARLANVTGAYLPYRWHCQFKNGSDILQIEGLLAVTECRLPDTAAGSVSAWIEDAMGQLSEKLTAKIPPVHITAPTQAKVGQVVQFSAKVGGNLNLTYGWDFGDGQLATVQNPTHTYLAAGNYQVNCRVTDGSGGSASATVSITVLPVAPPAPTGLSVTRAIGEADLTWTAVAGATGYKVYRGGTFLADTNTPSYADTTVQAGQTYSYTVTATANGLESVPSAEVMASFILAPLQIVMSDPQPQVGETVSFSLKGWWFDLQ